jgi:hypothetical protein
MASVLMMIYYTTSMAEKIIRDPVHDVIAFRLDQPVDAMLFRLINTPEFQRLRRIRQLGMGSLAYPGADHSRYSHSLGVMQTARRMLEQLARSVKIDPADAAVCLTAALLHDVGHGPLSHVFEIITGIEHEKLTAWIIESPQSQVHQVLRDYDAKFPGRVGQFLAGQPRRTFYNDIVFGQLDADRFDYLLRDNLHTGSRYGDFDLGWLLHALTVDPASGRLAVAAKGVSAVEAYLQSRYHMYRNVYFHKVVRTAEGMVRLALALAKRLAVQDRLAWPPRNDAAFKALLGRQLAIDEFTDLDDISMLNCLKVWSKSEDRVLAGICRGLLQRELYKTIDLTAVEDKQARDSMIAEAKKAIAAAGGDEQYDLFYDEPADTPYEIYDGRASSSDILVQQESGQLASFASLSPLTEALGKQLIFR